MEAKRNVIQIWQKSGLISLQLAETVRDNTFGFVSPIVKYVIDNKHVNPIGFVPRRRRAM